jgi:chemosensory pili system protein ChpA (sensor histidine kinase/response regulator)
MSKQVDNELLNGFFAEARSYLPEIMQGIVDFRSNPEQIDRLENSYRFAHTIKGASSMIGLATLSQVAGDLEEIFEEIAAGRMALTESTAAAMGYTVALIGTYLDSAAAGNLSERPFLVEAMESLRRLRQVAGSQSQGFSDPVEETFVEPVDSSETPPENPIFESEVEYPAFEEAADAPVEEFAIPDAAQELTQSEMPATTLAAEESAEAARVEESPVSESEAAQETLAVLDAPSEQVSDTGFEALVAPTIEAPPLEETEPVSETRFEETRLISEAHFEETEPLPETRLEATEPASEAHSEETDCFFELEQVLETHFEEAAPADSHLDEPVLEDFHASALNDMEIPAFEDMSEEAEYPQEMTQEDEPVGAEVVAEESVSVEAVEVEAAVEPEDHHSPDPMDEAVAVSLPMTDEMPPENPVFQEPFEEPEFEDAAGLVSALDTTDLVMPQGVIEEAAVEEDMQTAEPVVIEQASTDAVEETVSQMVEAVEADAIEKVEAVAVESNDEIALETIEALAEQAAEASVEVQQPAETIVEEMIQVQQPVEGDHLAEAPAADEPAQMVEPQDDVEIYRPEVASEFLEVFMLEAEDHLRTLHQALPLLADQPNNKPLIQEIRRSAHSLKGSAGMVGLKEITRLAHRMEDLLDLLYDGDLALTTEMLHLLFASTDMLEDMTSGRLHARVLDALYVHYAQLLDTQPSENEAREAVEEEVSEAEDEMAAEAEDAESAMPEAVPVSVLQKQGQFMRVPIGRLDEIVKLVTELIIARSSFEQKLSDFSQQLRELQSSSNRLRRVSSKMEIQYEASTLGGGLSSLAPMGTTGTTVAGMPFAPLMNVDTHGFDDLEFDRYTEFHLALRELSETASDVQTLDAELTALRTDFEAYLIRQKHLYSEIQDKLMRMRMVPVATLSNRLNRTVRTVATQRGKLVRLVMEGETTELDKKVLEDLADPLLHILRNAVDHGIESKDARRAKGKDETGTVRVRAYYEGTQVIIQISDDGAGLDSEMLRATAIQRGYLSFADATRMSDEDLRSLIFLPGFTTAQELSEISGRGVGLDVVKATVHNLKGTLAVDSVPDQGVTFTVRLPMTLAVMRGLLARAGNQTFAIPVSGVIQVIRIAPEDIEINGREEAVRVGEKTYPLMHLGKLLNLAYPMDESLRRRPALVMTIDGRQVAIAVDETLGAREIVVKNLGNHLRHVHGVTGATLLGDGSVVLILNVLELVRTASRVKSDTGPLPPIKLPMPARKAFTAMVVDDSPSVRRVVTSLLNNAGWKTVQAKDGLDAFEVLPTLPTLPDVILLDIEMPRMDGYEFLSTLRKHTSYSHVPVAILTSRAGQKHRQKAFELGADEYVVKPYRDEELLNTLARLAREQKEV